MLRFRRGLVWILALAAIGAGALVYRAFDGPVRQEGPLEVLGTRSSEAIDAESPAGPGPGEGQLAIPRANRDRRVDHARLDREVGARAGQAIHREEEASLAADEQLEAKDGTTVGARALRPKTSSSETRIAEVAEDRSERDGGRVPIDVFSRAVPQSTGRDAEPPDDRTPAETPGRSEDERVLERRIERDGGRDDSGDQGTDDASDPVLNASDPVLKGVTVGNRVMTTCANEPWICNAFSLAFFLPDTIPAFSGGTEAIQFPIAGGPDIVWIRTESGVLEVSTENLTDVDQLAALIEQLVPPR